MDGFCGQAAMHSPQDAHFFPVDLRIRGKKRLRDRPQKPKSQFWLLTLSGSLKFGISKSESARPKVSNPPRFAKPVFYRKGGRLHLSVVDIQQGKRGQSTA
jgi:hypothetical protein